MLENVECQALEAREEALPTAPASAGEKMQAVEDSIRRRIPEGKANVPALAMHYLLEVSQQGAAAAESTPLSVATVQSVDPQAFGEEIEKMQVIMARCYRPYVAQACYLTVRRLAMHRSC